MLEFIGIGDLHLDGPLKKYVPNLNQIICDEVFSTVLYGRQKGIENFFLYGDIAHKPDLSSSAIFALIDLVQRLSLRAKGSNFYVIHGNHDVLNAEHNSFNALRNMVAGSKMNNIHLLSEQTDVEIDDVPVRFLPWPNAKVSSRALNVAHVEVSGSKMDTGRASHTELSFGKALVVAGHLHTAQVIGKTHYSGTLYQTTFGESMPKYFHHGVVDENLKHKISLVKRKPLLRLHNVYVEDEEDIEKIPQDTGDLCKVYVNTKSKLTEGKISRIPSVVEVKTVSSSKEVEAFVQEDVMLTEEALSFSHEALLNDWLNSANVNKDEKAAALAEFERLQNRSKE